MLYIKTKPTGIPISQYFRDAESSFLLLKEEIVQNPLLPEVLKAIDGSTVLFDDIIETKYGRTLIEKVSTSCKCCLLALTYPDKWINFLEAGPKAISYVVGLSDKYDMHIVVDDFLDPGPEAIVNFNGKLVNSHDLYKLTTLRY